MEAIDKAIGSRAQIPGLLTKMAEDVVSRGELMSLMADLMKRIEALETAPATAAEVKPPPQTAAAKKATKAAEAEEK